MKKWGGERGSREEEGGRCGGGKGKEGHGRKEKGEGADGGRGGERAG